MAYDAASDYLIMLFFPREPLPPMHRVNGVHSALSWWLIALSSLYNICPQYVPMAYLELFLSLGIV